MALGHAVALARQLGAALLLIHVLPPQSATASGPLLAPPPASVGTSREPLLTTWTEEAKQLGAADVTSVEQSGDAAEKIVQVVNDLGCDAIVMGAHGRTGLKHLLVGSVAERVLRLARCPVLLIPHAAR